MAELEGVFKQSVEMAEAIAKTELINRDGYVLHSYADYETYKKVQESGNRVKLREQFVKESHIRFLADYVTAVCGPVRFGLCHGVRRGMEQAWFRAALPGNPEVIGTDISETANQFPDTIVWDFHDQNPDWDGRADFVYSNSWDHAFDPHRAFRSWALTLRSGGLMLLDHTDGHVPDSANALDPFGATETALERIIAEACGDLGAVTAVLDRRSDPTYAGSVVVFTRTA